MALGFSLSFVLTDDSLLLIGNLWERMHPPFLVSSSDGHVCL